MPIKPTLRELGRKPVQILSHTTPKGAYAVLIALCDDGSIWENFMGEWRQLPEIPQPEPL